MKLQDRNIIVTDPYGEEVLIPDLMVFEPVQQKTGILDQHGRAFIREPGPIGFSLRSRDE